MINLFKEKQFNRKGLSLQQIKRKKKDGHEGKKGFPNTIKIISKLIRDLI